MQENNLMNFNAFQKIKIFENKHINILCDRLSIWVKSHTGGELAVVGSLAKIFAEEYSQDYTPKDVDFVLERGAFSYAKKYLKEMEGIAMIEHHPHRIILYSTERICLEIWEIPSFNLEKRAKKYYKNLIPFLYGSKI